MQEKLRVLPEVDRSKIERFTNPSFQFLKRYRARRAKRKEIAENYRVLTSLRLLLGLQDTTEQVKDLMEEIEYCKQKAEHLEQQLCKL